MHVIIDAFYVVLEEVLEDSIVATIHILSFSAVGYCQAGGSSGGK